MAQENASSAGTHLPARSGGSDGCTGSWLSPGCGDADGTGAAALLAWAGAHAATASSTAVTTPTRPLDDPPDLGVSCRIRARTALLRGYPPERKKGRLHSDRHQLTLQPPPGTHKR